jgi:hypothetical protein
MQPRPLRQGRRLGAVCPRYDWLNQRRAAGLLWESGQDGELERVDRCQAKFDRGEVRGGSQFFILTGGTTGIDARSASNGLPSDYFSAHSLRTRVIAHMRARGATEDNRSDRSHNTIMDNLYDYATGLGPLASTSLEGGHCLDKKDLKRMLPSARKSL